jgi:hypothetical protein
MNIIEAAKATREAMSAENWHWEHVSPKSLKNPVGQDARGPDVSHHADSFEHIEWMLKGIEDGYIKGEKAHRWLGWAQAVIHIHQDKMPLDTFKSFNRNDDWGSKYRHQDADVTA